MRRRLGLVVAAAAGTLLGPNGYAVGDTLTATSPSPWGVLAELSGSYWGNDRVTFAFAWKVRGEVMSMTTIIDTKLTVVELRRGAEGVITTEGPNGKAPAVWTLPAPDMFRARQPDLTLACRLAVSALVCDQQGKNSVSFTLARLTDATFADRRKASEASGVAEAAARASAASRWGPFASWFAWDGSKLVPQSRFYVAQVDGQKSASVSFQWVADPTSPDGAYLIEAWDPWLAAKGAVGYRWQTKAGEAGVQRAYFWNARDYKAPKGDAFAAMPNAVAGKGALYQLSGQLAYRATADGLEVVQTKTDGAEVLQRYVLTPTTRDEALARLRENNAIRDERERAAAEAKRNRPGFFDALGAVAQGAVTAMGAYNETRYGSGAMPQTGGVENPLDANSAQNSAFRQNLRALSNRIAVDASSRPGATGTTPHPSTMAGSGPIAVPPPNRSVPSGNVADPPVSSSAGIGSGRTVAYTIWIGKEWKEGETGNGVCFSPVITRHFDTWPDSNSETILYDLWATDFVALERGCRVAGENPRPADRGYETSFNADTTRAQERVNASRARSYNTEVPIR